MPNYIVGKTWRFPEHSKTFNAGDAIELDEAVAENYMHNEPGLLKPARVTTQAQVPVTREKKVARQTRKK